MIASGNEPANRRLGDFEILRELGRGGMGVVYEARQVSLNRKVALKVLSGGLGLTPRAVQRFHREAEAAAKLHHTNIVPVYATGEQDGTHFYAMELIDGPSLDHVIRQMRRGVAGAERSDAPAGASEASAPATHNLEATGPYVGDSSPAQALTSSSLSSGSQYFDTVARMVADVADALHHAHQNNVVHRDIKPSNLLLSSTGRLSVNDFGLARLLEQPGMTMTGEFVGTPAYMSPEQITAGRTPLDHRTDIYSLGATLYELLTLQPPFTGERRDQVLAQILHKEPKAPRRVQGRVPVDLETICLKCLEKDPDRRYPSAGQLAEDLRRYVNRFAISARRAGPVQRLVKWVKRRPAVAASLGCVLIAICLMFAFAYQAHRARLQLLDEKISKAYMVAAGGDLNGTEEAIKEIERLGASTGQVRLLHGMVYYFRGDTAKALGELEQAVQLLPESIPARSLLAHSYYDNGQYERGIRVESEIDNLSPSSPEDYLFKGYAPLQSPQDAMANLNEGIRLRDSPLGRALRAQFRSDWAYRMRDLVEVEKGMADANAALAMAERNPRVLRASIVTHVIAAVIYQEANLPDKRTAALAIAKRCVQELEPLLDDLPALFFPVWFYYERTGDRDKAMKVARRSLDRSGSLLAANTCAMDLYHMRQFPEALQCLDRRREKDVSGDVMRALVLAETDGRQLALEEYEKNNRNHPREIQQPWIPVLLLLEKKEVSVAILRNLRDLDPDEAAFFRGDLSEEDYITKAGASRQSQSYRHCLAGLLRLATGDRHAARDHFQEGAHPCWGYENFWCGMFLSRMDQEPTWPPWIKPKQDQPKP
ncbi:MAG TPA: protein kinase [Gemmataceae bacterium]|nr:protein kinase [Gemmataceae bacterium]